MVKRPESIMNFSVQVYTYSFPVTLYKFQGQVEVFQTTIGHKRKDFISFLLSVGSFLLCMCAFECGSSVHADKSKMGKQKEPQLKHVLVSFSKVLQNGKPVVEKNLATNTWGMINYRIT